MPRPNEPKRPPIVGAGRTGQGRGWAGSRPASLGERTCLALVLLLASVLLLLKLGTPRLWQDEAETALLARNVLKFGVPRVWDGENLVAQYYGLDFNRDLLFQKPWLPCYLVAGSFALLGEGTAAARLPFALIGLLTVWLVFRTGRGLTNDPAVALLGSLLLALSLPFLLYSRQCRWYAAAMAGTLLLVEMDARLCERRGWARFGLAMALLFHTNYLILASTLPGLLVGRLWTRGLRAEGRPLILGLSTGAALTVPFLLLFPPFEVARAATQSAAELPSRIAWVTGDLNRYLLPLPGLAVLVLWRGRALLRAPWFRTFLVIFLLAIPLSSLALWSFLVNIVGFRYLVGLLPLAALMLAAVLRTAAGSSRALLATLVALHLGTHVLGYPLSSWPPIGRPGLMRTDLADYAEDTLHPTRGPIDAAVEYLDRHARPGETLFTPYEQLPFQFYTRVRTVGLQGATKRLDDLGVRLPNYVSEIQGSELDWFLPRKAWDDFMGGPPARVVLEDMRAHGFVAEKHVLDAADRLWQTREYPPLRYLNPPGIRPVEIYRFREKASTGSP